MAAERYSAEGLVPFICECPDPGCRQLARLTLEEYRAVRANPGHFLNLPGHESESNRHSGVVERNDRFIVVEQAALASEARQPEPASDSRNE